MILKMKTGFNGRRIFTVHTDQNADDDHNLESIFGIIRNFVDGECFGLGIRKIYRKFSGNCKIKFHETFLHLKNKY